MINRAENINGKEEKAFIRVVRSQDFWERVNFMIDCLSLTAYPPFYAPYQKIGAILFYHSPSVCLHKLNMKT